MAALSSMVALSKAITHHLEVRPNKVDTILINLNKHTIPRAARLKAPQQKAGGGGGGLMAWWVFIE
ncbi:hypothetical protein FRB97_000342 [Tulasnella sp. 331]|nr:hypothetical protein FRB97_000342 [Tulasnella sp. 331]